MTTKRNREIEEMISALKKHLRVLEDYRRDVFTDGNVDYAGEIAGKLRLLATKFGSNKPLLIKLMRETGIEPKVTLGGPPIKQEPGVPTAGDIISLSEFMKLDAIGIRVESGEFIMLNKIDFVRVWAEQTGSSHEDWSMDNTLSAILSSQVQIGGVQGALAELRSTTDTVLHIANTFIQELEGASSGA